MSCDGNEIILNINNREGIIESSPSYDINTKIEAFKSSIYEESAERTIESDKQITSFKQQINSVKRLKPLTFLEEKENEQEESDAYTPMEETESEEKNADDSDESHLDKVDFETNDALSSSGIH